MSFGKRILILVPHPDDEVVAATAALRRARAEGAEIHALYLTDGCIARETLWPWERSKAGFYAARRKAEAEDVARFLDIHPVDFADRPARSLWRNLDKVTASCAAAIAEYVIDQIWVPAYEGGNADHDGLNACAAVLKKETGVPVLEFAEYNFFQGRANSQRFPFPNGTETLLPLTAEEQAVKAKALALYESEQRNLGYVETKQECFRPLAAYDYSRPAHEGTLWYARFQWVPFRHPRVDFTKPQEVSDAISAFLARR